MRPLTQPLRWAGGKRQLVPAILARLPLAIDTYYEPFAGGAAVFFALARTGRFRRAVLSDFNRELVNVYVQIRDNCPALIRELRTHAKHNSEKYFYEQRGRVIGARDVRGAGRFVYVNRTCYNGLYRVNKRGQLNTPYGHMARPRICDEAGLESASRALQGVEILHGDFEDCVMRAGRGDAVYMDSPYVAASKSASFAAFHASGFGVDDQERLARAFRDCAARGAHVLLSNSDTVESRRIFSIPGNTVEVVGARRNINSKAAARGAVGEILVSVPGLGSRKGRAA
jgi:DNA adenine methylase